MATLMIIIRKEAALRASKDRLPGVRGIEPVAGALESVLIIHDRRNFISKT